MACESERECARERECVFVSFGKLAGFEIEAVAAPAKRGFAACEFMLCRFICAGSRSVTWAIVKSVPTVPQRSSEFSFISRIWPAVLVTGPARHLSARCARVFFFFFFYVTHYNRNRCTLDLHGDRHMRVIGAHSDTNECGWGGEGGPQASRWGPGCSMVLRGVNRVKGLHR